MIVEEIRFKLVLNQGIPLFKQGLHLNTCRSVKAADSVREGTTMTNRGVFVGT